MKRAAKLLFGISFLLSGCLSGPSATPSSSAKTSNAQSTKLTAAAVTAPPCGGGLTGGITATGLPGVAQYLCGSIAVLPPFGGPDASYGGTGETFSFKATNPGALGPATLNNSITIMVTAKQGPGTFDIGAGDGNIQFGYANNSFCASSTGSIVLTSVGSGFATGTFAVSNICDKDGNVLYTGVSGSFHIP